MIAWTARSTLFSTVGSMDELAPLSRFDTRV